MNDYPTPFDKPENQDHSTWPAILQDKFATWQQLRDFFYTQDTGYMGCTGATGPNEPAPPVSDEERQVIRQQNQKVDEERACRAVIRGWLNDACETGRQ